MTTATSGEWRKRSSALYQTEIITCTLCGKMIPARYWSVTEDDGKEYIFCDQACERLYREYWLPRYGNLGGRILAIT